MIQLSGALVLFFMVWPSIYSLIANGQQCGTYRDGRVMIWHQGANGYVCCIRDKCPKGTYPLVCESKDRPHIVCEACPDGRYMPDETSSVDYHLCWPKTNCDHQHGKYEKYESGTTKDRQCACDLGRGWYDPQYKSNNPSNSPSDNHNNPETCIQKMCEAGYEMLPNGTCRWCRSGHYKQYKGHGPCTEHTNCKMRKLVTSYYGDNLRDNECEENQTALNIIVARELAEQVSLEIWVAVVVVLVALIIVVSIILVAVLVRRCHRQQEQNKQKPLQYREVALEDDKASDVSRTSLDSGVGEGNGDETSCMSEERQNSHNHMHLNMMNGGRGAGGALIPMHRFPPSPIQEDPHENAYNDGDVVEDTDPWSEASPSPPPPLSPESGSRSLPSKASSPGSGCSDKSFPPPPAQAASSVASGSHRSFSPVSPASSFSGIKLVTDLPSPASSSSSPAGTPVTPVTTVIMMGAGSTLVNGTANSISLHKVEHHRDDEDDRVDYEFENKEGHNGPVSV